jgi:FKBP-type peptidyl-prolyl cis-trans isomerase
MRSFFYLLLLGVALLTLALVVRSGLLARKDPGTPMNSAMRAALESEGVRELSAEDAAFIREKYPETHHLGHGLLYVKTAPGTGTVKPHAGQELVVNYAGRLLNGTPFDSSYKRGVPFTFRVGTGAVIKGWDEAFLNMTKGEKRTLIVPYWLAYGAAGRPPTIPPKATLVFDVELIDIR